MRLRSPSGLSVEINANGSIRRMTCGDVTVNLFVGDEVEGGPANLWLRTRADGTPTCVPLLGPRSTTRFFERSGTTLIGAGERDGLRYRLAFVLSADAPAWFWQVHVENDGDARDIDLIYTQDLALAPYGLIRLNEYYVSQYVDHTALTHTERGCVVASRQNLAVGGRHPWCIIGSLRCGVSFATDALQVYGLASRAGRTGAGLAAGLPGQRLQHEHSMIAIQDAPASLASGAHATFGFFGLLAENHVTATSMTDLVAVDQALALPEAKPPGVTTLPGSPPAPAPTLFSNGALLEALELDERETTELFGAERRHEERDDQGRLLSFFCGEDRHIVLRAKELCVQRPHGHLLRTGRHLTPDEAALTSTTWMNGVFHSMLTQGHVSFNRFLSSVRSYLSLYRSHGQRIFVEIEGTWRLLDTPSAFEITPDACRWIYRHAGGLIEVRSEARSDPHAFTLRLDVRSGPPLRVLISHHVAFDGDDGGADGVVSWRLEGKGIAVLPKVGTEVHRRFPEGFFLMSPDAGTIFERIGGDELLFLDGQSREQPYVCVVAAASRSIALRLEGRLISPRPAAGGRSGALPKWRVSPPVHSPLAARVTQFAEIAPWFMHNALVHYLSPRGLEQFSGGGWGTRDVCQGPVELLLASGRPEPIRDLLLRVMRAQNPDGDWPQWFMFFERDRGVRAGDSHGDIVFWPVLALAQYLIAAGDASVLDEVEAFHAPDARSAQRATVWEHVQRALGVISERTISGTTLAAYGHGDWNDSLQPADPSMREHMCSAWTVTLHHQMLTTLARALRVVGQDSAAASFEAQARAVREDFQRLLIVDDVLAGYALFSADEVRYLLHPRDETSGVRYSALAMIHGVLENMLTPAQARDHLNLIGTHLIGPDGLRLFDRPMPYRGGPQRLFQRAESATFFGREIGLMYMHAHLRYAQALAHVGDAERFFHALCQVNPVGLRSLVPQASRRQANCYYSSSDAAFADRYEASSAYDRVRRGEIALDGGWRVYSSGAGIALGLIVRRFLGLSEEHDAVVVDPVMPASLKGLRANLSLCGRPVEATYEVERLGCGVNSIELNGQPAAFTVEENPYRRGAARVKKAELRALRAEGPNHLRIRIE
jgi:cellobiose phosphorylase